MGERDSSTPETRGARAGGAHDEGEQAGRSCDFCGRVVDRVQRVALDRDYERLQTPHPVRYACPTCSEEKERRRLAAPGR